MDDYIPGIMEMRDFLSPAQEDFLDALFDWLDNIGDVDGDNR